MKTQLSLEKKTAFCTLDSTSIKQKALKWITFPCQECKTASSCGHLKVENWDSIHTQDRVTTTGQKQGKVHVYKVVTHILTPGCQTICAKAWSVWLELGALGLSKIEITCLSRVTLETLSSSTEIASLGSALRSAMFETYFPWNDGVHYKRSGEHRCTIGLQSFSHHLTKYSKQWDKNFMS